MLKRINQLPSVEEIDQELPIPQDTRKKIAKNNAILHNIFTGKDPRKVMIVGPCSASPTEAVLEYAQAIKQVSEQVRDQLIIVLRTYIQKPRTTIGWTGPLNQPDPYGEIDISRGIRHCRRMMIAAAGLGLPLADEMLFTENAEYFTPLLSYIAIGARSSEDAEHRHMASALNTPVGMKNPTSGDINLGVNGVIAAQHGHEFAHQGYQVSSTGNKTAHLILRGGDRGPNYSLPYLQKAARTMGQKRVQHPGIIIDCSHDNCRDTNGKKDATRQPEILRDTLSSIEKRPDLSHLVKGWMIESFLVDGAQDHTKTPADQLVFGKSITDPCISLEQLTPHILKTAQKLREIQDHRDQPIQTAIAAAE